MGMDPKQQRVLEQQEGEVVPEDEPRDTSAEARPRAGKTEAGYGGGQASGKTGGSAVREDDTLAPPTGHGNLGRRPAGPDVQPKRPGKQDHR